MSEEITKPEFPKELEDDCLAIADILEIKTVLSWSRAKEAAKISIIALLLRGWKPKQ